MRDAETNAAQARPGADPPQPRADPAQQSRCAASGADLREMLQSEYDFAEKARTSVRAAFLEYLSADSWVLKPGPVPGRAAYAGGEASSATLEWYPTAAAAAGSGDLGFCSGPWVYTPASGDPASFGDYVSIWKRDLMRRWRVEFDGGVSHSKPAEASRKLRPDEADAGAGQVPVEKFVRQDAVDHAIGDFQTATRQEDCPAALRTYARNGDFRFYADGELPMSIAAAIKHLGHHTVRSWNETVRGRSADAAIAYSAGELSDAKSAARSAYLQLWQYDAKVANWGLRVLLISSLQHLQAPRILA